MRKAQELTRISILNICFLMVFCLLFASSALSEVVEITIDYGPEGEEPMQELPIITIGIAILILAIFLIILMFIIKKSKQKTEEEKEPEMKEETV